MIRNLKLILIVFASILTFSSCKEDEGKLPTMEFISGTGYTTADATVASGTTVKIGTVSKKAEEKDPLIKFDITESVNGAAGTSVYNKTLSDAEGDQFSYDYSFLVTGNPGDVHKLTFTITNRDGLLAQKTLSITVQ